MSTCILCFEKHTRRWEGQPNMYCERCWTLRDEARGTLSEILPTLFLGDMDAASRFDGHRMCVHEMGPTYTGQCHRMPILTTRPRSTTDRSGALVSVDLINKAADVIEDYVNRGEKLMVHCQGGIERSPLTIAWWLVRSKQFENFEQAYAFLKTKRPVVSQRLFWLPDGTY